MQARYDVTSDEVHRASLLARRKPKPEEPVAEKKPYEFQEYPKWVTPADGKAVLVQSAAEETDVLGVPPVPPPPPASDVPPPPPNPAAPLKKK